MKLSIILPVYNVEEYLENCLNSCLKQDVSFEDYEIIVVNDGSLDSSLDIALNMAIKYPNIKVFSQENKGLSEARNIGLTHSKGEYVWFVDSDDRIRENCLNYILSKCMDENLDLLAICAANIIDGKEVRQYSFKNICTMKGTTVLDENIMPHCAQFTICRKKHLELNRLSFYPGIFHEDNEFSPRNYFYANKVGFTDRILYLSTINPNSITHTVNPKRVSDSVIVARSIDRFYNEIARKEHSAFFHNYISLIINNALSMIENNRKEFAQLFYNNRYLFVHLKKSTLLKYRIEGFLFALFPKNVIRIYNFLRMIK